MKQESSQQRNLEQVAFVERVGSLCAFVHCRCAAASLAVFFWRSQAHPPLHHYRSSTCLRRDGGTSCLLRGNWGEVASPDTLGAIADLGSSSEQ